MVVKVGRYMLPFFFFLLANDSRNRHPRRDGMEAKRVWDHQTFEPSEEV